MWSKIFCVHVQTPVRWLMMMIVTQCYCPHPNNTKISNMSQHLLPDLWSPLLICLRCLWCWNSQEFPYKKMSQAATKLVLDGGCRISAQIIRVAFQSFYFSLSLWSVNSLAFCSPFFSVITAKGRAVTAWVQSAVYKSVQMVLPTFL